MSDPALSPLVAGDWHDVVLDSTRVLLRCAERDISDALQDIAVVLLDARSADEAEAVRQTVEPLMRRCDALSQLAGSLMERLS